jgi:hypothetical protein
MTTSWGPDVMTGADKARWVNRPAIIAVAVAVVSYEHAYALVHARWPDGRPISSIDRGHGPDLG